VIPRKDPLSRVTAADETWNAVETNLSRAEPGAVDLSPQCRDELLDPGAWSSVLETFASTMRLAVALTDPEGRLLGQCRNPQPAWRMARATSPASDGECPFCLAPPVACSAVTDALRTNTVVIVEDQAGLAHVAVPLSIGGVQIGALVAGQVFNRYPEPLRLQRAARALGVSQQRLWEEAVRQVPIARATLLVYGNLLLTLGQAVLGQRYAAVLDRMLAQTSRRFHLFIDAVRDHALLTMAPATRVTSWNSGAERLFGYTAAEIIGQDAACLLLPGDAPREVLRQAMLAADNSGWVDREVWRIRKDGTRFLGGGVLAAMGDGDAREYGELIRDVTLLRRSEQDMQQAQKLEAIGVLAGGIAHDFNNLLTGIVGSLSVVKTRLVPDDPSFSLVEIAEQSSVRAAELVAQLLAYAGKGQFVITRFDFSKLIAGMLPLIAASIPKSVELDLALKPAMPWIEGDASQIRQIVMNLIINGAEAIGPEGGTVRVSTGESQTDSRVFLEVKDSGSGMSQTTQARIFDPFFTTKFLGRGLGLAAVSGIVRDHHGTIHVASTPGQGTTFTVSFPAVPPVPIPVADRPRVIVTRGVGTILVVDDEPSLRQLAKVVLQDSGYSVLVAADGREAIEIFRENTSKIAAILLDMSMSVMGGSEAFRLLREIQPDVPIIISSGYSEKSAREECGFDTISEFIQKPYHAAKLVETIQQAIHHSAKAPRTS
jgi:PAS domain S-box-containing protein